MVKAVAAAGGSGSKPPQHRGPSARAEAVSEVTIKTGAKGAGCEPGLGHRGVELDQVVSQIRRGDGLAIEGLAGAASSSTSRPSPARAPRRHAVHQHGVELDIEAVSGASFSPARSSPARRRARHRGPLRHKLLAGTKFTGVASRPSPARAPRRHEAHRRGGGLDIEGLTSARRLGVM